MSELTEAEKKEIACVAQRQVPREPKVERKPAAADVAFATFASRFAREVKPVRFGGMHWKL